MTHRCVSAGAGIAPRRLALAILLLGSLAFSLARPARAQPFPGSLKQIGAWSLMATASSRTFHSCGVRRVQSDGFTIVIGLHDGGAQFFSMSAPRWDFQARKAYPLSLRVGDRPFTFNGMAMSGDTILADAAPEFFTALKAGAVLTVAANQRHFTMDLVGIEAATSGLKDCVAKYKDRTLPVAITSGPSAAPSRAPPSGPSPHESAILTTLRNRGFVVTNFVMPHYPPASQLAREQGNVYVRMRFPVTGGAADQISVERSSGYSALDESALESMKQMRIEPYLKDGKPSEITIVLPVQFFLRDPAPGPSR